MGCGSCATGGGGCNCSISCGSGGCPAVQVHDWLPTSTYGSTPGAKTLVEVAFKGRRTETFRNSRDLPVHTGDYVVVGADRGVDFGHVTMTGELVRLRNSSKEKSRDWASVIRIANLKDIERYEANRESEAKALQTGRQAVSRLKLQMKMVDAEWQFDRKRITFFFTADNRVDFRQLVRDLARTYHTRVDLRQLGARDETARIGGIGVCGRELCCSTWIQNFKRVSTNAAKAQNLPLNPVRLTGRCGRLKCCLNYELEQYMTALKAFPRVNATVQTTRGSGKVQKLDIFKNLVSVRYTDGTWQEEPLETVQVIPKGKSDPARKKKVNRGHGKKKRQ